MVINKHQVFVIGFLSMVWAWLPAGAQTAADDGPADAAEESVEARDAIISRQDAVDLVEDANLDDAIQRRPDLSFRNVTVNQEKSSLSLSEIPAQAVEAAEVLKAVTPDLDADTRGGALRVKIKPAYEIDEPVLKGKFHGRYKSIYDSWGGMANLTWAGPVGGDSGLRVTGEVEAIERGSDELQYDWSDAPAESTQAYFLEGADMLNGLRDLNTWRFNASFDHRFSTGAMIYIRGNWSREDVDGRGYAVQYQFGDEMDFEWLTPDAGAVASGEVRREGRSWEESETLAGVTVGGEFEGGRATIEWRAQHTEEKETSAQREIARFDADAVALSYDGAQDRFPGIVDPQREDATRYVMSGYDRAAGEEELKTDLAAADITWRPAWLGENDTIKTGVKFVANDLAQVRRTDVHAVKPGRAPDMSGFVAAWRRDDFLGRGFDPGVLPDAAAVGRWVAAHPDAVERDDLVSALRSAPASFTSRERVGAGYVMANIHAGRWRFLAGGRYEYTWLDSTGNEVIVGDPDFIVQPREASNAYGNFFPSLHARYRLNPATAVIASYTQTIRRPDFDDTAPFRIVETDERRIREGNPEARAMVYDNLDLAFDIEPAKGALVSWDWFYRAVSDSLYTATSTVADGPFAGYRLERIENGGDSSLWGSKLSWQQDLGTVSARLSPFSWNLAYTFSQSSAEYPERPGESLPLAGVSEHDVQAALSYASERMYIQLGLELESRWLRRVSEVGPEKDVYMADIYYLNLLAEYRINPTWTAFIDWENINRAFEEDAREGSGMRAYGYRWDPWKILVGVRFER